MNNWIYLFVPITSEVIATSTLKSSEGFTVLVPSIIVVAGYIAAFCFLSLTLSTIPIGVAYAIWSGVGIAMITLIGLGLFNQKLDLPAIAGILLIVSGVIVMYGLSDFFAH